MNFTADEIQALRALQTCTQYEAAVHARLIKAGFAMRNASVRFGKTVNLTTKGREFLASKNTGKTPVSGLTGLAANGGGAGRKRRQLSTRSRAETLTQGGSSPPVASRATAPSKRRNK
jgi:hypothetical protein